MKMIEHLITSTVLMLCILLIRMLFGNRMSQRLKYGLWLLVAIKLLVPIPMYEADISIMNVVQFVVNQIENKPSAKLSTEDVTTGNHEEKIIPEEQNSRPEKEGMQKSDTRNVSHADTKNTVEKQMEIGKDTASVNMEHFSKETNKKWAMSLRTVCVFIWLSGVLLCGSCFLFSNIKFYFQLRKDRKETNIYPAKLKIYETNCVESPCLFGMIKPAIYLPAGFLPGEEKMHHIMTHELTHYRHKDHIWTYIRCLCVVIYWYHPLVWLSAFLSIKDSELACDEGAVKCLGEESRKAYGVTLIEMASGYSAVSNRLVCSTSIMGGKKEMKKRIEMLVKKPKMLVSTFAVFLVLVIGVTGCTFSSGKNETRTAANVSKTKENKETKLQEDIEKTKKTEESLQPTSTVDPVEALEAKLTKNVPEGKYYLCIFPDELMFNKGLSGGLYYVPDEEMQKKIKELMSRSEEKKKLPLDEWEKYGTLKDAGYQLRYKKGEDDICFRIRGEEILTNSDKDTDLFNRELCSALEKMLKEELQYEPLDLSDIKHIVSAKLDYRNRDDNKIYNQTIQDETILNQFEEWFSNATLINGGSACPFDEAMLTLTMKSGKVVKLSMASDGCTAFRANGVYYDYRPQNKTNGFLSDVFYNCFDKIPNANDSY